jgi:twitching motility protein PilT
MDEIIKKFGNTEGLSDIHLRSNKPVSIRVNGIILQQDMMVSENQIKNIIKKLLDKRKEEIYEKQKDVDLAFVSNGIRLRANIFQTTNGPAMVLRKITEIIPELESLNLPPVINDVIREKSGLILVTGATGSGKSTSIAAMINEINKTRKENIITIEDPIEFVHKDQESIVSQREIGKDANTFHGALRAALREDPDVILVGELRDVETIGMALTAAETGHLIFGTLHTSGAPNTVHRIIDVFSSGQQAQIRTQLSQSLKMVLSQRLFPKSDNSGRIAAFEVMINNPAIANLIRENKIEQILSVMQTTQSEGMITMEKSLDELKSSNIINF